jgi:chromosome segregation protein
MPLRLKSLDLHGYKTFASHATFEFPGMITAIVGPNGSGKSNITDGLRWVLGEQSYGLLRGKKTEDMIFSGSEGRPRAGMASATIHFDNTEGWLPIDYSEVAITRRAYRDGQNEYLLNGQRVRLRDIGELLSQSGLSERTFTVIGQGLVDASLALRPDERRKLFEEAAGIGLYRSRREESLNRLETTHRNIERVQDIISELEPRLSLLEKQAKKAAEYERIKADLRMVLREWYGYHWFKNQQDLIYQQDVVRQQEKNVASAHAKYDALNHNMLDLRQHVQGIRTELNTWHSQASTLHNEKESVSREIAVIEERHHSLSEQLNNLQLESTRLQQEAESTQKDIHELEEERASIELDIAESSKKAVEIKKRLDQLEEQKTRKESSIADYRRKINQLENTIAQMQMQMEDKAKRRKNLSGTSEKLQIAIDESTEAISSLDKDLQKVNLEKDALEKGAKRVEASIIALKKEQNGFSNQLSELRTGKARLQGELARITIEIDVIHEAEKNLTGYSIGAKQLLTMIRKGDIQGMSNALSGDLVIPAEYEAAISAALGEFLDAIVIQRESDVENALATLENVYNARSTILSATDLGTNHKVDPIDGEDCLGNALDLIRYPDSISKFLQLVLGRTLIVKSRKTARKILQQLPEDARVVTLNGEIFYKNGIIIGGKLASSSRISRPRQLQDYLAQQLALQNEIHDLDQKITDTESLRRETEKKVLDQEEQANEIQMQLRQVNNRQQQISISLEKAKRQLDWNHTQQIQLETESVQIEKEIAQSRENVLTGQNELKSLTSELTEISMDMHFEEIDTLRSDYNYQQTNIAVSQRGLNELQKRLSEKQAFILKTDKGISENQAKTEVVKNNLLILEQSKDVKKKAEEEKSGSLRSLQVMIDPSEEELSRLDLDYNQLMELENTSQVTLTNAEKHLTQAQMELTHKRDNLEVLRHRIEEDFGLVAFEYSENQSGPTPLPIEGMVEELPHIENLSPDLEENLSRQKAMLRRIGSVNPEAQTEYQSTRERYDFLKNQVADLFKAEEDLKKILVDLDQLMKTQFLETFNKVSTEFPRMFNRLFGGGSGRLTLTDPDNIHDTGIDIHARLPGKREQELTLLSGGERSLASVALIFALLKVSPTPFCVLDEVDAALDETNVGRFRDLLVELSQDIQFILVTHNRNTVQAANVIYGITMGRDSTSQTISLRLDEVSDEMLSRS